MWHAMGVSYGRHMTTQTPTTTLDPETVDRLSAGFHRCFSDFDADDGLFAEDTFFDLLPPFWRFQLQGIDDFRSWLSGYAPDGHHVRVVRTWPTPSGFVTEQESLGHLDGREVTGRKVIVCEVRDGRIAELIVYCDGDWDQELRARHAAEAPMIRP